MTKREHNPSCFGGYLYELRKDCGFRFDEFRTLLGVSKAYLNDVESGECKPPTGDIQKKMVSLLCSRKSLCDEQIIRFYTLAAVGRSELPADVVSYLMGNPDALSEIRGSPSFRQYQNQEKLRMEVKQ